MDTLEMLWWDPVLPQISWIVLALTLVCALVTDVRFRRIPNILIVAGLLFGIGSNTSMHGGMGSVYSLAGALTGLFSLLIFFALRLLGAGDVKLLAMIGAFVGCKAILWIVLYTLALGGVLGLIWALWTRNLKKLSASLLDFFTGLSRAPDLLGTKIDHVAKHSVGRLPYALAIVAGTLVWAWGSPIFAGVKQSLILTEHSITDTQASLRFTRHTPGPENT